MKKSKFKLIPIFFALTLFNYTTNISAMENNKKENTSNKATLYFSDEEYDNENENLNLYERRNAKNTALSSINMYVKNSCSIIKKILNSLKTNTYYDKDALNAIKGDYINEKLRIEIKKKDYEEILNKDMEKYRENNANYIDAESKLKEKIEEYKQMVYEETKENNNKKLIDVEEYTKITENYLKIIDEKFNKDSGSLEAIDKISKAFEETKNYFKILNEKLKNKDNDIKELIMCNIPESIKKIEDLIKWFNIETQNKNKITENLIDEILVNIKDAEKYIKIIDEKFENYENQNKIKENKKTKFEETDLKKLKDEMEESFELNKKYFLNYIDSISKMKPIEELKNNKMVFEKSCNNTINLMKKYDDINTNSFNDIEIKEEIEDIIESFLIFYYKNNEYVFYSFLEIFKKTNPEKSKIDLNFATKYISPKDILESKIENLEELKIPKIESLLNELKINTFDLNKIFLSEKEELEKIEDEKIPYEKIKEDCLNIINKNNDELRDKKIEIKQQLNEISKELKNILSNDLLNKGYLDIDTKFLKDLKKQQSKLDEYLNKDLTEIDVDLVKKILMNFKTINQKINKGIKNIPHDLEEFIEQYNNTKKAFLKDMANIEIKKDENNTNFEINKKFMSSLTEENHLDAYDTLLSQYKMCNNTFNLIDYKKYNILKKTKDEFNNMKSNYIKHFLNLCESELDISLKLAIDKFYESFPQENIDKDKINKDEIFPKDSLDKFFKNYADAKEKCYNLNKKILGIDKYEKVNSYMEEKKESLKNYTMILRGYGENPFLNLLTQNTEKNKKVFDSLEFRAKIDDYKRKIKQYLNRIEHVICSYIKNSFSSKSYEFFACRKFINKNHDLRKSSLFNILNNILDELKILINECKQYLYDVSKELIEKNKETATKIYGEKVLKKNFLLTLEFIENIKEKIFKEKAGLPNLTHKTEKIIKKICEYIEQNQIKIKKAATADLFYESEKFSIFLSKYGKQLNEFFNSVINYESSKIFLSDDYENYYINSEFEKYFKELDNLEYVK